MDENYRRNDGDNGEGKGGRGGRGGGREAATEDNECSFSAQTRTAI